MKQEIYEIIKPQVLSLCEKAEKSHYTMYQGEITGPWEWRRVSVLWDPARDWFEAKVSYSKGWPHLHYAYGHTVESLIKNIAEIIE